MSNFLFRMSLNSLYGVWVGHRGGVVIDKQFMYTIAHKQPSQGDPKHVKLKNFSKRMFYPSFT